ncbi:MAG: TRAP transporter substrate-binding protein DctP [Desulfobacteraceae bacterium]
MKKHLFTILFALAFVLIWTITPCVSAEKPIEVKFVTFVDRNHMTVKLFQENWREVEKRSQGKIKFTYQGGPEAIPIFSQAMAVYRGATDMVLTTPSFMGKLVKGASMLLLCDIPVEDHRKSGLHDYMNTVFNKVNMQYLQMVPCEVGESFVMLSKKKISSIEDFKGLSLRGGDFMDAVAPAMGMSTVSLKHFEEYSALERGVIDIGRMTIESMMKYKLYDVAKYMIQPNFGTAQISWFMNLKKWNSIPKDLQNLIIDTLYELAPETQAKTKRITDKMYDEMPANGVAKVELKEKKLYQETIHKAMYDYFLKEDPKVARRIYELSH